MCVFDCVCLSVNKINFKQITDFDAVCAKWMLRAVSIHPLCNVSSDPFEIGDRRSNVKVTVTRFPLFSLYFSVDFSTLDLSSMKFDQCKFELLLYFTPRNICK